MARVIPIVRCPGCGFDVRPDAVRRAASGRLAGDDGGDELRPDGRPRLCGNAHCARCVHQIACIACEAFIDHEMASAIERRDNVLTIAVPIPLPPHVVATRDDEGEGGGPEGIREALPPVLPSAAFYFNTRVPRHGSDGAAQDLRARLEYLEALVAEKRGTVDRRSTAMQALVQELDRVRSLLAVREREGCRGDGHGAGGEAPRPHSLGQGA